MMETKFAPLTLSETREIINLKAAYGQFWRSQKFAKGYESPFCSRSDVEKALSEAAEIVVRLRSHLDRVHDTQKKRVLAGSSQEHLFALDTTSTPANFDPAQFARDLVHATLRDSQGYVEELNEETVDSFIGLVRAYHDARTNEQLSTSEQCEVLYNDVLHQWSRDQELMNQALPDDSAERSAAYDAISLADLQSLKVQLAGIEQTLRSLRLNRMRITRSPFLDVPGTPFPAVDHTDPADEARSEAHVLITTATLEGQTSAVAALDDGDEVGEQQPAMPAATAETTTEQTQAADDDEVEQTPAAAAEDNANQSANAEDDDADVEERDQAEEPSEDQVRTEAFIAIEKVASHVDQVASEFKGMLGEVEPLWSEEPALRSRPIESLKKIEGLHSTVVGYSEELLQDLMRLDDIEVDPQARAERKRHVIAIQALMDDLDGVASKLKSLKDVLKIEADKVRASSPVQSPERAPSPSQSSSSSSSSTTPTSPVGSSERPQQPGSASPTAQLSSQWDKLKLELQWDKDSSRGAYLIQAMIPGLDHDKIKFELADDGSSFTISGCRVPTAKEEHDLRQYVRQRYRYSPSEEDSVLLRVASGRYGSFRNTFTLPDDALPDQIRPTYDRGVLRIQVPRRQVVPQPQQRRPAFGGYGRHPGYPSRQGGFFNDRDLWW